MDTINQQIASMLQTDGSDAPQRFGAAKSPLYHGLKWALEVKIAFDQGLSGTVRDLRDIGRAVDELPATGAPGELRNGVRDDLDLIGQQLAQKDFHKHKADLATRLTALEARIGEAVRAMRSSQKDRLREAERDFRLLPEWSEFNQDEQSGQLNRLQSMEMTVDENLAGLKRLIARQFDIDSTIAEGKDTIVREGQERRRKRETSATPALVPTGAGMREPPPKLTKVMAIPRRIVTTADLDALIEQLRALRHELGFVEFDVTFTD